MLALFGISDRTDSRVLAVTKKGAPHSVSPLAPRIWTIDCTFAQPNHTVVYGHSLGLESWQHRSYIQR